MTTVPIGHKLAEHHGLHPEQVMVTAGSTALLGLLCQTLIAPGLNAVTSQRSFIVYSLAVNATGASLIETPMANDVFDLNAILDAIDEKTALFSWPIPTILPAPSSTSGWSTILWPAFPAM